MNIGDKTKWNGKMYQLVGAHVERSAADYEAKDLNYIRPAMVKPIFLDGRPGRWYGVLWQEPGQ